MSVAILRVDTESLKFENHPLTGRTTERSTMQRAVNSEKRIERDEEISGVTFKWVSPDKCFTRNVYIDADFFVEKGENLYSACFVDGGLAFEVSVRYEGGLPSSVEYLRWSSIGCFEDDEEPDYREMLPEGSFVPWSSEFKDEDEEC